MSAFDALDFFQAQKQQERQALRTLEESRARLGLARTMVEDLQSTLMIKRNELETFRKRLAASLSAAPFINDLNLVLNRASVINSLERATVDKVAELEGKLQTSEGNTREHVAEESRLKAGENPFTLAFQSLGNLIGEAAQLASQATLNALEVEKMKSTNVILDVERGRLEEGMMDLLGVRMQQNRSLSEGVTRITTLKHEIVEAESAAESVYRARLHEQIQTEQREVEEMANHLNEDADSVSTEKSNAAGQIFTLKHALVAGKNQHDAMRLVVRQTSELLKSEQVKAQQLHAQKADELAVAEKGLVLTKGKARDERTLWEERQKAEDALFSHEYARTVLPKREAVATLKTDVKSLQVKFKEMASTFADQYAKLV
jgi:hypothetical protein